jgi:lysophospholipase L1-like esterase
MIQEGPRPLRYVALGDSYTIGTAVDPAVSWPSQLADALVAAGASRGSLELVANLGVNGYTSSELIRDQLPEVDRLQPGFVSLLVGVNDVVRGIRASTYEANVRAIFDALTARLPPDRIVTVSIPDYTATPRGLDFGNPAQQSREIVAFNRIMAGQSAERSVRHVDILDLSLRAAADRSLVAADGLHPSGAQYALWVDRIAPVVASLLAERPGEVSDRRA